jgi:GT2 family glycosyltransferase
MKFMEGGLSSQLSVIVVVYSDSENFRMALEKLRAQTVFNLLELIIVTPSIKGLNLDSSQFAGFSNYKTLELGPFESEGAAKAMGVKAASSPLIAFIEDHSYPEPGWAEALIEAHRKGNFAVVGPIMLNANPYSGLSWGCFLVYYGHWIVARPQEEVKHLPANQSCYKRDLLLRYGARLSEMLEAESVLHWDLLSRGYRLYQEPTARVHHLNYSLPGPMLSEYYLASRVFAAKRALSWSLLRRVLYALGSPLLPLIRLRRILKDANHAGLPAKVILRAFVALVLVLCTGTMGEILGYAFGVGKASKRLARFESKRHLSFTQRDLEAVSEIVGRAAEKDGVKE